MGLPTFAAQGSVGAMTTSGVAPYPATTSVGQILWLYLASDAATIPSTIAGWTEYGTINTSGSMSSRRFYQYADGTEGGSSVTITGVTGGTMGFCWITSWNRSGSGFTIAPVAVQFGTDTTSNSTSYSAAGAGSWTTQANDLILSATVIKAAPSLFTGNPSGGTITSSGSTLGTNTGHFGSRNAGNTAYTSAFSRPVTVGGTGAPGQTFTTVGTNGTGHSTFILMRESASAVSVNLTGDVVASTISAADGALALVSSIALAGQVVGVTAATPAGVLTLTSSVALTGAVVGATTSVAAGSSAAVTNIADSGAPAGVTTSAPAGSLALSGSVTLTGAVASLAATAPAGQLAIVANVALSGAVATTTIAAPAGTLSASSGGTSVNLGGVTVTATTAAPAGALALRSNVTLTGAPTGAVVGALGGTVTAASVGNVTLTGQPVTTAATAPVGALILTSNVSLSGEVAASTLNALAGEVALSSLVDLLGESVGVAVTVHGGVLYMSANPPGRPSYAMTLAITSPVLHLDLFTEIIDLEI